MDLPIGKGLRADIASLLAFQFTDFNELRRGNRAIADVIQRRFASESRELFDAASRICKGVGLVESIDDYINTHASDSFVSIVGKLAIARAILDSEKKSKLYFKRKNVNDTINFVGLDRTWYPGFYSFLQTGIQKSGLGAIFENVSVVCFNYDRCIEHYLVHALDATYHIGIEKSRELVEQLPILRPYGTVGEYFGDSSRIVEFGRDSFPDVSDLLKNLRTYTERIDDEEGLAAIRKIVSDAEVLVFLGCAFHENNMKILSEDIPSKVKAVYFTRRGISAQDMSIVKKRLSRVSEIKRVPQQSDPTNLFPADSCYELFDSYRMSLRD